jgi:POT family proton-dependent oligopeptide transporter
MPSTWYQSVNAFTIVLCAPIFSWLWIWLAQRRKDPSTPMKFAIGLWLLGLSFIAMVFGALDAKSAADGLAGPHWLFITYVVYTWGELCLSPVGLSMVTKLAPKHLQSLLMGIWFMSLALSNLIAGLVAAFAVKFDPAVTAADELQTFIIPGKPGFFLMLVVFPIGAGLVIALLTPMMRKMMRGIH